MAPEFAATTIGSVATARTSAMLHGELAMPVLAGLRDLAGRLDDDRALGTATDPALAVIARARVLLETAYADRTPADEAREGFAQGGLAGWQRRAIDSYIDDHLDESLGLACLAAVARLSPSYLCRAFRRSHGCSPMQYVTRRRLAAAQALLRDGTRPLREIALHCGFADQAHFTRVFRTTTGETPRRWQQLWQHCAGPTALLSAPTGLFGGTDAHSGS